jgi:hypothetical protein
LGIAEYHSEISVADGDVRKKYLTTEYTEFLYDIYSILRVLRGYPLSYWTLPSLTEAIFSGSGARSSFLPLPQPVSFPLLPLLL